MVAVVAAAATLCCGRSKLHSDERFVRSYGALYLRCCKSAAYTSTIG